MHGKTLRQWEARRSGGRITINGYDIENGKAAKVPNVDAIEPVNGDLIATDKNGVEHRLLVTG